MRYGRCENGEYGKRPHFRLTCVTKKRLSLSFPLVSTGTVESTKNTLGSLSNNNGDGNENVTLKVNSRCFKLYRALFHLVYFVKCWQIFLELNAKGLYQSSKKKKKVVVLCSRPRQNVNLGTFTLLSCNDGKEMCTCEVAVLLI